LASALRETVIKSRKKQLSQKCYKKPNQIPVGKSKFEIYKAADGEQLKALRQEAWMRKAACSSAG